MTALSIEESIKKLKAEIIAQDWRLSPKRAAGLEEAFQCLRQRFKNRRATNAMLIMAGSVLEYIKNNSGTPPETIDFLKESMAHVVNLHEDLTFDPEKEEQLFAGLFKRFQRLKTQIKADGGSRPVAAKTVSTTAQKTADGETADINRAETKEPAPAQVKNLIEDLINSLNKAGEAGTAIGQILSRAIESPGLKPAENGAETRDAAEQLPTPALERQTDKTPGPPPIRTCPPTELRQLSINGVELVVPTENIALIRSLKDRKMHDCLRKYQVPLKYFSVFMQKLSRQFSGSLANIKDNKLKQVILPIVMPQGFDFAEASDKLADTLMVISAGNWHGVLACSNISEKTCHTQKIESRKNGDIAGLAHLEDGRRLILLDSPGILRREGFLLMA